jgi:NADPH:quinone reductase-like Zn-dependent oxidoreductase
VGSTATGNLDHILIIGGGSNTAQFGVSFAKLAGFMNILVTASPHSFEHLKSLGPTHLFDRHSKDSVLQAWINAVVGDVLIYAYDPINIGVGQALGLKLLSKSTIGKLAVLRRTATGEELEGIMMGNPSHQYGHVLGVSHLKQDICIDFWKEIAGWIERGQVKAGSFATYNMWDTNVVQGLLDRVWSVEKKAILHPVN